MSNFDGFDQTCIESSIMKIFNLFVTYKILKTNLMRDEEGRKKSIL